MARKKVAQARPQSKRTGRYVQCPASGIKHDPSLGPIYVAVFIRERAFTACGCNSRWFAPPDWKPDDGYTYDQAMRLGTVLS